MIRRGFDRGASSRACVVVAIACVVVVVIAGCATTSQPKDVEMTGGPGAAPEGPVLDRGAVANMCPDEPFACALGGLLYLEADEEPSKSSAHTASDLLEQGCEAELPVACATLASMYVTGRRVEVDLRRAERLYRQACSQHGAFGCMGLGRMYETGASVSRSARQSGALYERACRLGEAEACHRLWEWRRRFDSALGALEAAARGCAAGYRQSCDALENHHEVPVTEGRGRAVLVQRLDDACQSGRVSACELLGRHYESGDGAATDRSRAAEMYRRSCDAGDESDRVARACDRLGALYEEGLGVSEQPERAAALFERSCEAGWSVGCSHLASLYERGAGVGSDDERAMELYRTACSRGHARACLKVGSLLEPPGVVSDGSTSNDEGSESTGKSAGERDGLLKAAVFYQIGCSSGSGGACNSLGVVIGESGQFEIEQGRVVRLYQRACELEDANGCFNLAAAFRAGEGVERSASEALKYFRRACDRGMNKACQFIGLPSDDSTESSDEQFEEALRTVMLLENACDEGAGRACTRAGVFHREGRGGLTQDAEAAVRWFRKSCKRGDPSGCAQYAYHLQEGLGVSRDLEAAAGQFAVACQGGAATACTYLGALYASGDVEIDDPQRKAADLFKAACEEDDPRGCLRLARMLRGGWNVPIDTAGARSLLEKACEGGAETACSELEELESDEADKKGESGDGRGGKGSSESPSGDMETDEPPDEPR